MVYFSHVLAVEAKKHFLANSSLARRAGSRVKGAAEELGRGLGKGLGLGDGVVVSVLPSAWPWRLVLVLVLDWGHLGAPGLQR